VAVAGAKGRHSSRRAESKVREGWGMRDDVPQFLYDLVETIKKSQ
jgi:hypothetical protein